MDGEERCEYCRYAEFDAGEEMGECHRYPPTAFVDGDDSFTIFPHVAKVTWCGEFKRRCN